MIVGHEALSFNAVHMHLLKLLLLQVAFASSARAQLPPQPPQQQAAEKAQVQPERQQGRASQVVMLCIVHIIISWGFFIFQARPAQSSSMAAKNPTGENVLADGWCSELLSLAGRHLPCCGQVAP